MSTKLFRNVRQKYFDGNLLYPLLSIKFFDTSNYLEHWRDAPRSFSVLWDPKFSPGNAIPFIIHETFRYPKFSETLSGCAQNFSALWDKKRFNWKIWYPLLCINFPVTPNYLKHWRNVHKTFQECETKIFWRKFVIPPIIHKIFRYLKLSGTLKGCPKKFFGIMRSKIFAGKRDTLYYTRNFSIPQVIGTIERMRTKLFGTVGQKFSTEKCDTPYYA